MLVSCTSPELPKTDLWEIFSGFTHSSCEVLEMPAGDERPQFSLLVDLTHMVHIIDTEHPWDVYSVNSGHTEVITCLEWDQSGELGPLCVTPVSPRFVHTTVRDSSWRGSLSITSQL